MLHYFFNAQTVILDSSTTLTGTPVTVLPQMIGRRWVLIQNRSSDNIWLRFGDVASVAGNGCIGLIGLGSNVQFLAQEMPLWNSISMISSGASSPVTVLSDQ